MSFGCPEIRIAGYNKSNTVRPPAVMADLRRHVTRLRSGEFVETILAPCSVPWAISPSSSGVTLTHSESDVEPECTVVFGGGHLNEDARVDSRRIEIQFSRCYYARLGYHRDTESIKAIGYKIDPTYNGKMEGYLEWRQREWNATGHCPNSGFYVATKSAWLLSLQDSFQTDFRHYVIDGREGYVELIARRFSWREWLWIDSHREKAPSKGPVVGSGKGVA